MYDFDLLKKARETLCKDGIPFLDIQREKVRNEQPYQGLTILHNVPLTLVTVFKIEVLAIGGACVIATNPGFIPHEKRAVEILRQAHVVVKTEPPLNEPFDFHLDCCGELMHCPAPKMGTVELTQSGSKLYKSTRVDYPILSVDDSKLKVLETFFGTGDGFARAFRQHMGQEATGRTFVIFGYGKVGRGIVYALKRHTNNIVVIDQMSTQRDLDPDIQYIDARDTLKIKRLINQADCVITATGVKDLLTDYYSLKKADFGHAILTNMGAEDEYGPNFVENEVVFGKRAFNFSLTEPTAFRYLDPIFYAHNLGLDLILSKQVAPGYHPFPLKAANEILNQWQSIYHENLSEALRGLEVNGV